MSAHTAVRSIMTTEVLTAAPETSVGDVLDVLVSNHISSVPVIGPDRRVLGVVSEADLMLKAEYPDLRRVRYWSAWVEGANNAAARALATNLRRALARRSADLMTQPPVTVSPAATVEQAAHLMHERNVKRLPVVDPEGRLVGIVSRSDILKALVASTPRPNRAGDGRLSRQGRAPAATR